MLNVEKITDLLYPEDELIGIDIGNYSLKIVVLSKKVKEKIVLKAWSYTPLKIPQDISVEEKRTIISNEIRTFLEKHNIKTKFAATSVSGNSVIVRYVKLPWVSSKELEQKIRVEAESFIPFDINDVYLSYYVLNPKVIEEGQDKIELVLCAAKKDIIDDRIEILKSAGLIPVLIDVDSFAIENTINAIENEPDSDNNGIMVVNIGHRVTNLSILSSNAHLLGHNHLLKREFYSRLVRDIFIAGYSVNRGIMKKMSLNEDQADEFKKSVRILVSDQDKIEAIKDYNKNVIISSGVIKGIMKDLVSDMTRSVDFLSSTIPELVITKIYLCGGGSAISGLREYLESEMKIPVRYIDPFICVSNPPKGVGDYVKYSLAVSFGLSLRSIKSL